MRATLLVVLVVLVAALVVACEPQTQSEGLVNERVEPRREIRERMESIDSDLAALGLTQDALKSATPVAAPPARTCTPGVSPTCGGTCKLDDSLCGNARRICKLSDQLASDGWAVQQCERAKRACSLSRQKCCACQS